MQSKLFLPLCCLLLASCSNDLSVKEFFRYRLDACNTDYKLVDLVLDNVVATSADLSDCFIVDSLVFSISSGDRLFDVTDLKSGELKGSVGNRGRAGNEMLMTLPLFEVFNVAGQRYTNLYSISDSKFCLWNIDKALDHEPNDFGPMIQLVSDPPCTLLSLWRVDDHSIVALDASQNPYSMTNYNTPSYVLYDTESGRVKTRYDLFNDVDMHSSEIPSMAVLSTVDCISPDRKRLVFAMGYMPVITIMDIESGKAHGFVLGEEKQFDPKVQRWYFADIAADKDYIYALYSGEDINANREGCLPNILFVLDWSGKVCSKVSLNHRFSLVHIDGEKLFLTSPDGYYACVDLPIM